MGGGSSKSGWEPSKGGRLLQHCPLMFLWLEPANNVRVLHRLLKGVSVRAILNVRVVKRESMHGCSSSFEEVFMSDAKLQTAQSDYSSVQVEKQKASAGAGMTSHH